MANKSVVNAETQDMVEHDLIVENIPPSVVDESMHIIINISNISY